MLTPDDWREYIWGVARFDSGEETATFPERRIWRMTVTAGMGGGTLTVGSGDAVSTITFGPNEVVVLEPKGMVLYVLSSASGLTAVVEFIRKVSV